MDILTDKNPANDQGVTPLHLAAEMGHIESVEIIFEWADDKCPMDFDEGWTPFHLASKEGHLSIVQFFLKNLELPKDNENNTPLHLAIEYFQNEVFQEIYYAINDINSVNRNGESLIEFAERVDNFEVVEFLKKRKRIKAQN